MRDSMELYPATTAERAMKLQEALLRATLGKVKWSQPVELIGKFRNGISSGTRMEQIRSALVRLYG
jgi:hypothetical protein